MYAEKLDSNAIRNAMNTAEVRLQDMCVTVSVGTQLTKATILQETGILEFIRQRTHEDNLYLDVIIDPSLAPEEDQTRPRNKEEIYQHMVSQNPLLESLVNDLDLKLK